MRDNKLLEEYRRSRSDEAFARIVARYVNPVFSTCLREVNDRQTAEDLTQAVFLLLARKVSTLNPNVALSGWLFNTSRLVSHNALREDRRRRAREQKAALMQPETELARWNAIDNGLNEALAALNAGDRLAILLRYFDELSVPEVAQELGVSTDAAQMRVHRAVDRLRLILVKQGTAAIPAVALTALLTSGAVKMAHAEFAGGIVQGSAAAGSGITIIVEGVMKHMWLAQLKTAACVSACAVVGLGAVGSYSHHRIAAAAIPRARTLVQGYSVRNISAGAVPPMVRPAVSGQIGPDGTNTYHLAGSEMLDGKTVPWEVWGRRTPYFYYERTGLDVIQDDGNTMSRMYGPDAKFKRDASVGIIGMPSDAGHYTGSSRDLNEDDLTWASAWQSLTDAPSWSDTIASNRIKPKTRTGDEIVFEIENKIYTSILGSDTQARFTVAVNDNTLRHYQFHVNKPNGAIDLRSGDIEYGNPIPADILQPLDTSQIITYDARPNVPGSLASTNVPLHALAVDADGNILIEAKIADTPLLECRVYCHEPLDVPCRDAHGEIANVRYLTTHLNASPDGSHVILLSPLEPLPSGERPVTVGRLPVGTGAHANDSPTFTLDFSAQVEPPMDHAQPLESTHPKNYIHMGQAICSVYFSTRVDLQGAALSLDLYKSKLADILANGDFHKNVSALIAKARASRYKSRADSGRYAWLAEHPFIPDHPTASLDNDREAYFTQHHLEITQYVTENKTRAVYWAERAKGGASNP